MTVTALVSAKSCGVTTSALAMTLSSTRPSLLAECDPAGGTIRAGLFQAQITAGTGLYHLAVAERAGEDALAQAFAEHLVRLDESGHRQVLPGLTDPAQAPALARSWPALAQVMRVLSDEGGYDVVIDAGRLALESGRLHSTLTPAPLLHGADLVLLVVRATDQSLALARHMIEPLRNELTDRGTGADALGVLLIEDGPRRAHEVSEALRLPVMAALPWEPDTAAYLAGTGRAPRKLNKSALLGSARTALGHFQAAASRRALHQKYPPTQAPAALPTPPPAPVPAASAAPASSAAPQVAGVLQRLGQGRKDPRV
ncbi:MinD/ParA family protein [Streptomyces sp. NPDC056254]|uniref:MinD/ParA family ATP-binding protein n=1 Tax=Streptomyces sp. NPDC056254 TaxID=3345763 RepID=UPI0035DB7097